jgi:hypothetical protein
MLLTIAALVLVLLITFGQSICGLFSAAIMFLLAVLSASISFATYESLNEALLGKYIGDYGDAAALMVVFLAVLIVSRLVVDTFVKKNLEFPGIIDRLGAVVFGFGTAMILTGMLAVAIQLLPFGPDILGFDRLVEVDRVTGEPVADTGGGSKDPYSVRYESHSLWPSPDGFTVRLISMLSAHSFSGRVSFADVHPDFLDELQMLRMGPGKDSRRWVPPDTVEVKAVWPLEDEQLKNGDPSKRAPENEWLCLRTRVKSPDGAVDSDKSHRFAPIQVRLIGWKTARGKGSTEMYTPIGLAMNVMEDTPMGDHAVVPKDQPIMMPRTADGHLVDFVFDVPKSFVPWFLAYKRGARAEVRESLLRAGPPQPKIVQAITEETAPPAPPSTSEQPDRVPGRHVHSGLSRFDRSLPVALEPDWMTGTDVDISDGRFHQGHCVADWPLFEAEPSVGISNFFVPPGMKLFQLSVTREEAHSIYGRALQFTRETLAQYTVIDERGQRYFRIGEIRIANVGGQEKLEIQYWPQAEMPERCIQSPRVIQNTDLTGDYTLIYLFLIPEDRTPEKFDTGNRIRLLKQE